MKNAINTAVARLDLEYRQVMWRYRWATWQRRALPDFIIIGAQKAGTSSLYAYLSQHPQIVPSLVKEVYFFDGGLNPNVDNFKLGQAWYRIHFPLQRRLGKKKKTFEASPLYLFNPLAPQRIAGLIPQVKLIALLRNPTERAISHYFHAQRAGLEPLPIMEALQAEEERLRPLIAREDYKNDTYIRHSYKSRGLYYDQISNYLRYFPGENILILNSEKLFTEPEHTLRRVYEFVGVDPNFLVKDLSPRNIASNRTEVAPECYAYLNEFFRKPNQTLRELIEEDYGW